MSTPSAVRASAITADVSGSSRSRSRSSASTNVTRVPSRANACAISQPMAPPPRTIIESGRRSRSNSVSLVSGADSRRPGIAGTVGRAPVATTNRFERIARPSTSTAVGRREAGEPVDHIDAVLGEGSGILGGGDALDGAMDPHHGFVEPDARRRRGEQRLRRDASGERAVAPDRSVLHDDHAGFSAASLPCGDESAGTATDHHEVVRTSHVEGNPAGRGPIPAVAGITGRRAG